MPGSVSTPKCPIFLRRYTARLQAQPLWAPSNRLWSRFFLGSLPITVVPDFTCWTLMIPTLWCWGRSVSSEIDIDGHDPAAFTGDDKEFLEEVAQIVGTYIEGHDKTSTSWPSRNQTKPTRLSMAQTIRGLPSVHGEADSYISGRRPSSHHECSVASLG